MTNSADEWSYSKVPLTDEDLDLMLRDLDAFLAKENLTPAQRPIHAVLHVARTFGYEGPLFEPKPASSGGTLDGARAINATFEWYERTYADRLKMDFGPGAIVVELRRTLWRMRLPRVYGHVRMFADTNLANRGKVLAKASEKEPATSNILPMIDGITQGLASALSRAEIVQLWKFFLAGFPALMRLESLKGDDLFVRARADYEASVDALMNSSWHNARWDTAQCCEKVFKGLLRKRGRKYPTGRDGHKVPLLGGLVRDATGAALTDEALRLIDCPTRLRYGEMSADQPAAMRAHRALLGVLRWIND